MSFEETIVERHGIKMSFEEMKSEFLAMDTEIREKAEDIQRLRQVLNDSESRYAIQAEENAKNVDEMEELHEHLAELDGRFERSESLNLKLREDVEELKLELQLKDEETEKHMLDAETKLRKSKELYERLDKEHKEFQTEANSKYQLLLDSVRSSTESICQTICDYLGRRRDNILSRRGQSYRVLKSVEEELRVISTSCKES